MKIHFEIRRKQLVATNAMNRKLQRGFVLNVVSLNVHFEVLNVVDRLRTVETFSRNDFAVLQFVFCKNCEIIRQQMVICNQNFAIIDNEG